ncbi:hypothetical protein KY289_019580 [Solanum tuberosum]|nr:hypothetical protein KY289_019580 [Solanum tuberosum]
MGLLRTFVLFGDSSVDDDFYYSMSLKINKFCGKISSLFSQDNDEVILEKYNMDSLVPQLLEEMESYLSLKNDNYVAMTTEEKMFEYLFTTLHYLPINTSYLKDDKICRMSEKINILLQVFRRLTDFYPILLANKTTTTQYLFLPFQVISDRVMRFYFRIWNGKYKLYKRSHCSSKITSLLIDIIPLELEVLYISTSKLIKESTSRELKQLVKQIVKASLRILQNRIIHLQGRMAGAVNYAPTQSINIMIEFLLIFLTDIPKRFIHPDKLNDMLAHRTFVEVTVGHEEDEAKMIGQLLDKHQSELDVISIVGMPGLGKTTLAKKVYNNTLVASHFNVRAWCTVSQKYNRSKVLGEILQQVTGSKGKEIEDDLAEKLRVALYNKRYLIVLDDVWDIATGEMLIACFPKVERGNRVILTSRSSEVGLKVKCHSDLLRLQLLTLGESWKLFEKMVFGEGSCLAELLDVGHQIVEKCQGLPLTVVLIAGVIVRGKKKEKDLWHKINMLRQVFRHLTDFYPILLANKTTTTQYLFLPFQFIAERVIRFYFCIWNGKYTLSCCSSKITSQLIYIIPLELEVLYISTSKLIKESTSRELKRFFKQIVKASPRILQNRLIHLQGRMAGAVNYAPTQSINVMIEFLLIFLTDIPKRFIHPDKLNDMLAHVELLTRKISILMEESSENNINEADFSASNLLQEIERMKGDIKQNFLKSPDESSQLRFPMDDGFLFMNLLLRHLNDLLISNAYSASLIKKEIGMVKESLEFIRSSFKKVRQTLDDSTSGVVKDCWLRALDVAYEAEHVINSILVRDKALSHLLFSLPNVTDKIKLIVAEVTCLQLEDKNGDDPLDAKSSYEPMESTSSSFVEVTVGHEEDEAKMIDQLLDKYESELDVISIVGMPGLGKTTLAKKVYNNTLVASHFNVRAWCTVSQKYNKSKVLGEILQQVTGTGGKESEDDLAEKLRVALYDKRYLIVLDDVWDIATGEMLIACFSKVERGNRVILTSRSSGVGLKVKCRSDLLRLQLLKSEKSWELFEKRVFGEGSCPAELLDVGHQIVEKCQGLPLAVVLIAGLWMAEGLVDHDIPSKCSLEEATQSYLDALISIKAKREKFLKLINPGARFHASDFLHHRLTIHTEDGQLHKKCVLFNSKKCSAGSKHLISLKVSGSLLNLFRNRDPISFEVLKDSYSRCKSYPGVVVEPPDFGNSVDQYRIYRIYHGTTAQNIKTEEEEDNIQSRTLEGMNDALKKFPNLQHLECTIRIPEDPPTHGDWFPNSLKELRLFGFPLTPALLSAITALPQLEILAIILSDLVEDKWDASEDIYQSLKTLTLQEDDLSEWEVDRETFHKLEELKLEYCEEFTEIPCAFAEIETLNFRAIIDFAGEDRLQVYLSDVLYELEAEEEDETANAQRTQG